jgi:low affinity Fe/Cu permease
MALTGTFVHMMNHSRTAQPGVMDRFFAAFSGEVAKWTGSAWAFTVVGIMVLVGLSVFGVALTNIAISVVTLLMVFVLQNTQNRDSAALHLKLDEIVRVEPEARDDVRGVESKSEPEIRELTDADVDAASAATARGKRRYG